MIYGYVRISTKKQNIERQIRNIKQACKEAVIIEEVYTGTSMNRTEYNKLVNKVNANDIIYFDSVSRMARNAEEGFKEYENLFNKGVELRFIKEPHINTEVYRKALNQSIPATNTNIDYIIDGVNKYLMALAKEQIIIAFKQAEKEVLDLRQRTREGIETARLNGKQIGRAAGVKVNTKKSVKAKEDIIKYNKDFEGTLDDKDTIKLIGIARNTFYKYKKELKEELV